jgi:cobalt/nickel transport system ATP-binding protein
VILSDGVIVADDATPALLADDALLAAHRLELPYGFHVPVLDVDAP